MRGVALCVSPSGMVRTELASCVKGMGFAGARCFMRSIHQDDRRHAYGWGNDGIAIRSKVWTHELLSSLFGNGPQLQNSVYL